MRLPPVVYENDQQIASRIASAGRDACLLAWQPKATMQPLATGNRGVRGSQWRIGILAWWQMTRQLDGDNERLLRAPTGCGNLKLCRCYRKQVRLLPASTFGPSARARTWRGGVTTLLELPSSAVVGEATAFDSCTTAAPPVSSLLTGSKPQGAATCPGVSTWTRAGRMPGHCQTKGTVREV